MYRSFIKSLPALFLMLAFPGHGQQAEKDSLIKQEEYGLRVGIDLSRLLITALNENYEGLEIAGDFRVGQRLYLAAELGNESKTVEELLDNADGVNQITIYNLTSSGSYIKLGVDFNTYENWYGMNNSIFVGARYAYSSFSNTLNSYSIYDSILIVSRQAQMP